MWLSMSLLVPVMAMLKSAGSADCWKAMRSGMEGKGVGAGVRTGCVADLSFGVVGSTVENECEMDVAAISISHEIRIIDAMRIRCFVKCSAMWQLCRMRCYQWATHR